jgi:hypothetical protein
MDKGRSGIGRYTTAGKGGKIVVGRLILGIPVLILLVLLLLNMSLRDPQFNEFIPQKIAPVWVNLCTLIMFLLGFELGTQGRTIRALMWVTPYSGPGHKIAAAIFVGLIAIAAAIVIAGA